MAKVTINPSEEIIATAMKEFTVIDEKGRSIALKKPGVLAQYRLIEALGDTAKNSVYTAMVMPLLFVASIDGEQIMPCTRKSEIEALIQRLDDEGIKAVMNGVNDNFGDSRDLEADKQTIKK